MSRFSKVDPNGEILPDDAEKWLVVLDNTMRLMWTVEETKRLTHEKALAAVKALRTGGFEDWRLPSVEELFLLADRTRLSPAIDTAFFPACKSDWYWTSTAYAGSPGVCAWFVDFSSGGADWYLQNGEGFVRAVRASQ